MMALTTVAGENTRGVGGWQGWERGLGVTGGARRTLLSLPHKHAHLGGWCEGGTQLRVHDLRGGGTNQECVGECRGVKEQKALKQPLLGVPNTTRDPEGIQRHHHTTEPVDNELGKAGT